MVAHKRQMLIGQTAHADRQSNTIHTECCKPGSKLARPTDSEAPEAHTVDNAAVLSEVTYRPQSLPAAGHW